MLHFTRHTLCDRVARPTPRHPAPDALRVPSPLHAIGPRGEDFTQRRTSLPFGKLLVFLGNCLDAIPEIPACSKFLCLFASRRDGVKCSCALKRISTYRFNYELSTNWNDRMIEW